MQTPAACVPCCTEAPQVSSWLPAVGHVRDRQVRDLRGGLAVRRPHQLHDAPRGVQVIRRAHLRGEQTAFYGLLRRSVALGSGNPAGYLAEAEHASRGHRLSKAGGRLPVQLARPAPDGGQGRMSPGAPEWISRPSSLAEYLCDRVIPL
jgi:hypothetical protein